MRTLWNTGGVVLIIYLLSDIVFRGARCKTISGMDWEDVNASRLSANDRPHHISRTLVAVAASQAYLAHRNLDGPVRRNRIPLPSTDRLQSHGVTPDGNGGQPFSFATTWP